MHLNPEIWGPHYWFFLHTIVLCYPRFPNAVTKKKYYDFVSNLPLFIPVESISTQFSKLLDNYPVTPYLDSKESFVKWMHFIHNKINEYLEKPKLSLNDFYVQYYDKYKSNAIKQKESNKWKKKLIYTITILSIVFLITYLYNK
uniref:thiol oxidase n=1 Tax=viral metagenome TaxID=1070528 RepID=A0A6C0E274_9ZZZZ